MNAPTLPDWLTGSKTTIRFSLGTNNFDNCPEQHTADSFESFRETVLATVSPAKHQMFFCAPLKSGPHYNPKFQGDNHWRIVENVEPWNVLTFDADGFGHYDAEGEPLAGLPSPAECFAALLVRLEAFKALAYTTSSSTPERPRLRIAVALGEAVSRAHRQAFSTAVEKWLAPNDDVLWDRSVYRGEQPNYCPVQREGDAPFTAYRFDGQAICPPPGWVEPDPRSAAADSEYTPDLTGRADSALMAIPNDEAFAHRDDWRDLLTAAKEAGVTKEVAEYWSNSFDYGNARKASKAAKAFPYQWKSLKVGKANGLREGLLFKTALKAGWIDPEKTEKVMEQFSATPPPQAQTVVHEWDDARPDNDPVAPPFPDPFPGVMADVFAAVIPMANKPQPELTVLSLLIGMASCVSGRYYFGNGQRANLFGIGVCETGGGKDWVRLNGEQLAHYGGAKRIDQPASGEGLEDSLIDFGGTIMSVDEVGFMFAATNAHNAQSHLIKLKREILRLFSASRTVVHGRLKAGGVTRPISHPCLNILGFTTPSVLGRNMTCNDVSSGELPRYMMVFGRDGVPQRRTKGKFVMPEGVVRQARLLTSSLTFAKKDVEGLIEITASPAGDAALDAAMVGFASATAGGTFSNDLLTRAYEKVERIAMVLAVWNNPITPVILPDMVEWAVDFVTYSNWSLTKFADKHMVSEASIANAGRIVDIAGKIMAGKTITRNENEGKIIKEGFVPWSLLLNRSKYAVKEFSAAVDYLVQTDQAELSSMSFTLKASGGVRVVKVIKFKNV